MTDVVETPPAAPAAPPAAPVPAPPPAASAPPAAPAPGPAAEPPAANDDATILAAAAGTKPLAESVPEKHRVMKEDGTLDAEATLANVERHRASLESRIGTGDVRPKNADEYQLVVPEPLKALAAALPEAGVKGFQAEAFAAGLTQRQYEFVVGKYLEQAPLLASGARAIDRDAGMAALKTAWPAQADFDKNVQAAVNATTAYAGDDAQSILADYGNDPRIVKMLALIGGELKGPTIPSNVQPGSGNTAEDIRALMRSEAYTDSKNKDHVAVSAKVRAFFESGGKVPPT